MAAGGFKEFVAGEVLDEDDINDFLMQGVLVFAGTAARGSAITSPVEGQFTFLKDTDSVEFFDGTNFVPLETGLPVFDYLVVAGGASGAYNLGGGGGAGGYLTSIVGESSGGTGSAQPRAALDSGQSFTVTVGAGGATDTTADANGNQGSNSVFGGLTCVGGGAGGAYGVAAGNPGLLGGSGGGGGGSDAGTATGGAGGAGTTNQGFAGGKGFGDPGGSLGITGGGGGGAGAVGAAATSASGGVGGNGVASTITGSSVTRAGGGGGGGYINSVGALGGTGGGGEGGDNSPTAGTAGTVNTGSGGGGGGNSGNGGAGGSGIVILKYPSKVTLTVGAGLTSSTTTSGEFKITSFTAGTDTVTVSF